MEALRKEKRKEYIDITKGVGMILVQMGHTAFPEILKIWIYSFHMPLFFVLSGLTFSGERYTFKEYFVRKVKNMLIPYYFFIIINMLCNGSIAFILHESYDYRNAIEGMFFNWHSRPMWFVMCLFWTEIIYYILWKYILKEDTTKIVICMFVSAVVALLNNRFFHIVLPFDLDIVITALFFLTLGQLIKAKKQIKRNMVVLLLAMILINMLACLINYQITDEKIEMVTGSYGIYSLFLCSAISGSLMIIAVCKYIEKRELVGKKILVFIGKNSIVFYGVHQSLNRIIDKGLSVVLPFYNHKNCEIIVVVFLLIISFSIISIITLVYNKTVKRLIDSI